MDDDAIEPRDVSLRRIFPWLRLLRGIGLALDARKLLLALLGVILMWAGWTALDAAFPGSRDVTPLTPGQFQKLGAVRLSVEPLLTSAVLVTGPIRSLAQPFLAMFGLGGGPLRYVHALAATLWGVLVWGVIGAAIARIALVQVARGDRIGLLTALKFGLRKVGPLLGAPLGPLVGVAFFAALCGLLGLLYRIPGTAGATVAGILAFLPLLAALVMTLILIGLAAGWPLMVATVAAEGEDTFDALSRSYSYVYQRPLMYAFFVVIAWVVGAVGFLLVVGLAFRVLLPLAAWGLAFGAPDRLIAGYFGPIAADPETTAAAIHAGWISFVTLLTYGFIYSYFWSAAAQIYLLLRHDVDGAPFNDIAPREHDDDIAPPSPVHEPAATAAPPPATAAPPPATASDPLPVETDEPPNV